jgi:hypothetical protein
METLTIPQALEPRQIAYVLEDAVIAKKFDKVVFAGNSGVTVALVREEGAFWATYVVGTKSYDNRPDAADAIFLSDAANRAVADREDAENEQILAIERELGHEDGSL